jgi:hypothetical protein
MPNSVNYLIDKIDGFHQGADDYQEMLGAERENHENYTD